MSIRIATVAGAIAATAIMAGGAHAQSVAGGSASFNGGYGRYNGQENQAVDFSIRGADGNLVAITGILQPAGAGNVNQSSGSSSSASGSASASASAGVFSGGVGASASASAIGNNLTVVTQGNYNTVIVESVQINNGNVSANSSAGGGR